MSSPSDPPPAPHRAGEEADATLDGPGAAADRRGPWWGRSADTRPSDQQLVPRSVQRIGAIVVAVFVARADPAPGFDGRGPVVLFALVLGVAAFLALPRTRADGPPWLEPVALWTTAVAGAVLCWASPDSPGSALAFAAMLATGTRWPAGRAVPLVAVAVAVSALAAVVYEGSTEGAAAYGAGFVATWLGGLNRRQFLRRVEETELLLAQTQRSREEQVRAAALAERTRIARDVHDVLAHSMAGLTIQLDAARLLLERADPEGRPLQHVARAHGLARDGLREAREAVGALRGDAVPLRDGLDELVADRLRTGTPATLEVEGDVAALAPDAAWALLRIAREAATNATKHAAGHALVVRLVVDAGDATLEVTDHPAPTATGTTGASPGATPPGAGALSATGGGYGLRGMTERAEAIGGTVQAGPHGDGWRVLARVPAGASA
ncbi:sensor histidine kinase [Patulibacter minatonensis]|uniref:sensor histidine kinase n=1 Tax=Patulibacter minatonensis TaxID=298163 RepID=UPI0004B1F92C|nr:histidine kinase [Patulibacter minatonensis]